MAKNELEIQIQGNIRVEAKKLQDAFLNTLGWKGVRKLEQFATVNAARALAKPVQAEAPNGHGALAASVRGRRSRITKPGAVVGPVAGKKHSWYAWFVVKGTKPHHIPKISVGEAVGAQLSSRGIGRNIFDKPAGFMHPGVPGDPFVDRAVSSNIRLGEDAVGATIALLLVDENKRNMVLGMEVAYKNGSAAQWQSKPYLRHWKNADYLEPFTKSHEMPDGPDKVKAIASSLTIRREYKRRASGTASYGVAKRVNINVQGVKTAR